MAVVPILPKEECRRNVNREYPSLYTPLYIVRGVGEMAQKVIEGVH